MKPLATRIAEYAAMHPVETTMVAVYQRVLGVLEAERALLHAALCGPRRLTASAYRRRHAELLRLSADIAIIAALRDRHLGTPTTTPHRDAPPAMHGYGEP